MTDLERLSQIYYGPYGDGQVGVGSVGQGYRAVQPPVTAPVSASTTCDQIRKEIAWLQGAKVNITNTLDQMQQLYQLCVPSGGPPPITLPGCPADYVQQLYEAINHEKWLLGNITAQITAANALLIKWRCGSYPSRGPQVYAGLYGAPDDGTVGQYRAVQPGLTEANTKYWFYFEVWSGYPSGYPQTRGQVISQKIAQLANEYLNKDGVKARVSQLLQQYGPCAPTYLITDESLIGPTCTTADGRHIDIVIYRWDGTQWMAMGWNGQHWIPRYKLPLTPGEFNARFGSSIKTFDAQFCQPGFVWNAALQKCVPVAPPAGAYSALYGTPDDGTLGQYRPRQPTLPLPRTPSSAKALFMFQVYTSAGGQSLGAQGKLVASTSGENLSAVEALMRRHQLLAQFGNCQSISALALPQSGQFFSQPAVLTCHSKNSVVVGNRYVVADSWVQVYQWNGSGWDVVWWSKDHWEIGPFLALPGMESDISFCQPGFVWNATLQKCVPVAPSAGAYG